MFHGGGDAGLQLAENFFYIYDFHTQYSIHYFRRKDELTGKYDCHFLKNEAYFSEKNGSGNRQGEVAERSKAAGC